MKRSELIAEFQRQWLEANPGKRSVVVDDRSEIENCKLKIENCKLEGGADAGSEIDICDIKSRSLRDDEGASRSLRDDEGASGSLRDDVGASGSLRDDGGANCKLGEGAASSYGFMSMTRFRALFRVQFRGALKILHEEGVPLRVVHEGRRVRYEIPAEAIPGLLERHGTEEARALRRERPACRRGVPLTNKCPKCGLVGRQFRHSVTPDGFERARCGHCRHTYITSMLETGARLTRAHCGDAERQHRTRERCGSRLLVFCGKCLKRYTVELPERSTLDFVG